jgi:energy-coupling factor transporter transmembrane protein EcfT
MHDKSKKIDLHFFSFLFIGISASLWAIFDVRFLMPLSWLIFISLLITINNRKEIRSFTRRFLQIGVTLLGISLLQIIFRREGLVLVTINNFPLIWSEGLREAALLWIRFMIIFSFAYLFIQFPIFKFLVFTNKMRLPLNLSYLLLSTFKLIPFIFSEAKRSLLFMRFRGIQFSKLAVGDKIAAIKQLIFALLMRSIHYLSYSALALELRGYGRNDAVKIPETYPLRRVDYFVLFLTLFLNGIGFYTS